MSAEQQLSWYHCGHCGQLFRSELGEKYSRACAHCGKKTHIKLQSSAEQPETVAIPLFETEASSHSTDRKKRNLGILKVVLIWLVLMTIALLIHRYFRGLAIEEEMAELEVLKQQKREVVERDRKILEESLASCHQALVGLISADLKDKTQFIWNPTESSKGFEHTFESGKFSLLDVNEIQRVSEETFQIEGETFIETHWMQSGLGEFDAVFRKDNGKWKLDWKHFSRASDFDWISLIEEDGEVDGEMRVLAKITETDNDHQTMKIAVFPNGFLDPVELPEEPIVFAVDQSSDEGLLIKAAVDLKKAGRSAFRRNAISPKTTDVVRVRARIRRVRVGDIVKIELKQVVACHWIDSGVVGFDLSELRDDLFSGK
ncbi:hypothetical protein [Luteolibacter sp. AS25]|uniref:hypothetical protein n=1 Tax=Luteolibacter sp. AS25 TaxID=3135776 RepID=UPI00398AED36